MRSLRAKVMACFSSSLKFAVLWMVVNFIIATSFLLSIDWHQVLDTVRCEGCTLRPKGYYLLPEIKQKIQTLKRTISGLTLLNMIKTGIILYRFTSSRHCHGLRYCHYYTTIIPLLYHYHTIVIPILSWSISNNKPNHQPVFFNHPK